MTWSDPPLDSLARRYEDARSAALGSTMLSVHVDRRVLLRASHVPSYGPSIDRCLCAMMDMALDAGSLVTHADGSHRVVFEGLSSIGKPWRVEVPI